jgi:hypothetical protein
MRFHPPFDDVQWSAAAERHRLMRSNLHALRRHYPPRSAEESQLLKDYRDAIQEFSVQLLKPMDKIDPRLLNDLTERALCAFVMYRSVYGPRGEGD